MFESNEPFPCPTLPTEWDCLESNQHLCLARQCSRRCALKKAGGYRTSGKTPGRQNRELLVIALACF
ncbi:hypothetical protein CUC51_10745 [Citrobacter freundii]|nr:hypothetical protein C2U38_24125 [Citrobacter freundii complex sp. CFNIH3]AYL71165.1 hypothetical protein CUC51_10745 [Citrobacter freundii]POV70424.1 hypothetical protein C3411_13420 [Citrobacter freundii complex sp. CFNIH5]